LTLRAARIFGTLRAASSVPINWILEQGLTEIGNLEIALTTNIARIRDTFVIAHNTAEPIRA
jgi:hypothetical protein